MENTIAVVSDPLFLEHRVPRPSAPFGGEDAADARLPLDAADLGDHPERPERLEAALLGLADAGLAGFTRWLEPRDATLDELGRVHDAAYLDALSRIQGRAGYLDSDTYFVPSTYGAARRAAGGCVALVDALLDRTAAYGLGLVRPPGHHARPGAAMGFCLLNNVAVAAAHARSRGAERVAIVDWDVHHGNGTQEIFYEDPSVLFVSLHQFPFYPGTGAASESGAAAGVGATVNVPLSAGAGDGAYVAAFERIVGPALASFDPDLVLVSAGFDAHVRDPLAEMCLTEAGYAAMLRQICAAIPRGARGRLGLVLEGGYDLVGLRESLRATLQALDSKPEPTPPALIAPAHERDLEDALRAVKRHTRLP